MLRTLFALCIVLSTASSAASLPPVLGREIADDADIVAVSSQAPRAWLLEFKVENDSIYGYAYLPPTEVSSSLRRGSAAYFVCPGPKGMHECKIWQGTREWVQVADGSRFLSVAGQTPVSRERPFRINGEIPDRTLLSLVQFLRSSPLCASKGQNPGGRVEGQFAITDVMAQKELPHAKIAKLAGAFVGGGGAVPGGFSISTEGRHAKQYAEVIRGAQGWEAEHLTTWPDDEKVQGTLTVRLEWTHCRPSVRRSCSYHFGEVVEEEKGYDKRFFDIWFYDGADQAELGQDAISRLDRFFEITRENPTGIKDAVTLCIVGTTYEFSREDGDVQVDIENTTR